MTSQLQNSVSSLSTQVTQVTQKPPPISQQSPRLYKVILNTQGGEEFTITSSAPMTVINTASRVKQASNTPPINPEQTATQLALLFIELSDRKDSRIPTICEAFSRAAGVSQADEVKESALDRAITTTRQLVLSSREVPLKSNIIKEKVDQLFQTVLESFAIGDSDRALVTQAIHRNIIPINDAIMEYPTLFSIETLVKKYDPNLELLPVADFYHQFSKKTRKKELKLKMLERALTHQSDPKEMTIYADEVLQILKKKNLLKKKEIDSIALCMGNANLGYPQKEELATLLINYLMQDETFLPYRSDTWGFFHSLGKNSIANTSNAFSEKIFELMQIEVEPTKFIDNTVFYPHVHFLLGALDAYTDPTCDDYKSGILPTLDKAESMSSLEKFVAGNQTGEKLCLKMAIRILSFDSTLIGQFEESCIGDFYLLLLSYRCCIQMKALGEEEAREITTVITKVWTTHSKNLYPKREPLILCLQAILTEAREKGISTVDIIAGEWNKIDGIRVE